MAGIAGRIPGAIYKELPGTPHMQTLERPELVAAALNEFLPAGALN
jgi:3-oxoadipate enol-lactonase